MEPKIIVMIVTLAMPDGASGVHVKPLDTVEACIAQADIEASDPFVQTVECSELEDGALTLQFARPLVRPTPSTDRPERTG